MQNSPTPREEAKQLYEQLTPENQKKAGKFIKWLLQEQMEEGEGNMGRIREVIEHREKEL